MTDQQPAPRRSRRNAYTSLADLQRRAQAATPADEADTWGEAGMLDDAEDESFDEADLSDTGEDHVDSDFDEPETADPAAAAAEADPEAAVRSEERRAKRARTAYVDPALARRRKAKATTADQKRSSSSSSTSPAAPADTATASTTPATPATATAANGAPTSAAAASSAVPAPRARTSLRKTTKVASERAAELRRADSVAREARRAARVARDKDRSPTRPPTQDELLAEAKETEKKNNESLQALLRVEEEKRRVAAPRPRRAQSDEPVISVRSRDGVSTVSVSKGVKVDEALFGASALQPPTPAKTRLRSKA